VGKLGGVIYEEGKGYGVCYSCETTLVVYLAWRLWCMIFADRRRDDLSRSNLLHLRLGNSLGCDEGLDKMKIWLTRNLAMPLDFVICVLN
jgi:hypothetical protein